MEKTKRKRKIIILCLAVILPILFLNMGIDMDTDAGGCLTISFDKFSMLTADRLVVFDGEREVTITDADFVRRFTGETVAGTSKAYCCMHLDGGAWVEVYKGDRLVRHMRYIENHDALAYDADLFHWVLFGKEGHAFLSRETSEQLGSFLEE